MSLKDQFKKAFEAEDTSWDKEASWVEIEKLLPQKKKRRPFFIWWFGLGLFLLMIPLAWNMMSQQANKSISQSPKMEQKTTDITQQDGAITSDLINKEDRTLAQNFVESNSSNLDPVKEEKASTAMNPIEMSSSSTMEPSALKESIRQSILDEDNFTPSKTNSPLGDSQTQIDSEKGEATIKLNLIKQVLAIQDLHPSVLYTRPLALTINGLDTLHRPSNILPKWEWSFLGGIGVSSYEVNAEDAINDAYAQLHQNSSRPQEHVFINSLIRRRLNKNWSIGSGIYYQRSFDWYDGTAINTTRDTITQDSARFYTLNGVTSFVSGERTRTITQQSTYESPIVKHEISIPVEIAFRIGHKNHSFLTSGTFYSNVFYQHSGRIYNDELVLLSGDDDRKSSLLKSKWVNAWSIAGEYLYQINERTSLGVGLRYKRQISSSFQSNLGINERLHQFGLQVSWTRSI
jgi:hypothetical protein